MRRTIVLLLLLLLAASVGASAQVAGGNVSGTVTDEQGGAMDGVAVTLQGADLTKTYTTEAGGQYRFLNLAPGSYKLTVARAGFTTIVRDAVIVDVQNSVALPVQLKVAPVEQTVVVAAASPIVDTRQMGTSARFTSDELTKIPTSRDPFAIMRTVPGLLVDRVNIGGNETGQQPNIVSKGTRPQDAVWTMDGVVITDMVLAGTAPTYFNYDNFDQIHVTTAGQDITQSSGGAHINLVVKRGTNQYHGSLRGYFANESMEASNVPDELAAAGVTPATADHNKQLSDFGGEFGGPILKDKAWFYGSYSFQDIRLVRRSGNLVDKTTLSDPNVKLNWQATSKDLINFLYYDGFKTKRYRSPGTSGITIDAPTATFHQQNAYTDSPFHGLWKFGDDRVLSPNMFLSAKYAYYNTGFALDPEGGLDMQAGRDLSTGRSYGSTSQSLNVRPQQTVNLDLDSFTKFMGVSHDLKYGFRWRRIDATTGTNWPGNGILALQQNATTFFAELFRQGLGTNRLFYTDFYLGDTIPLNRLTIDAGLRFDRQWGRALPGQTAANPAYPAVLPGVNFAGYDAPFTWNNISPRVGATYALDQAQKTILRASYNRSAGQLEAGTVGFANPSSLAGAVIYRWIDRNADHFSQADEVQLDQFVAVANGFNQNNPTAVTSANQIDPNLTAPITQSFVAGLERELRPNLAVQVNYTYTNSSNLYGNVTAPVTPRVGMTVADYAPGPPVTGTLPDGTPFNVPTFIPNAAKVSAGNGGFLITQWNGFNVDYHGLEIGFVKRLSDRWMGRVALSYNNARDHYESQARYDTNGNPTPTVSEPLVDGGQFAPKSTGNAVGEVYLNAKWQFNANGMYEAKYGIEVAGSVFGRQGYPFPYFRPTTLGADTNLPVLVTPRIDTYRYDSVWDTDMRVAREFKIQTVGLRVIGDVFNLFNANTVLIRNNNVTSTAVNTIAQNLSPRIFRIGLVVRF